MLILLSGADTGSTLKKILFREPPLDESSTRARAEVLLQRGPRVEVVKLARSRTDVLKGRAVNVVQLEANYREAWTSTQCG